ncbi:hypothetical protein A4X06_0g9314 [Tilletia controversa]|uniref:Retrotransposon gag domain-containing protein n=1 Tax=Tilletia controversa TaxID=13291 RepID=A0A8X7MII0_9BASI|nr:hypothetical protein CF328_g8886 [Tilletia controversa]KAE8237175.1 hypothetical protein A4X06_0g9314 [Tilletia controversa]CAD6976041.1 unnamed protein product [Tilletia controversa]
MAPKKRKDISDNVDNSGGNNINVDAADQRQVQPSPAPTSSSLSIAPPDIDDDDFGGDQDLKESDNGTIRKEHDSGPKDNNSDASHVHLPATGQAPEYMTSEEIELEIQILQGQHRILNLRKALIKNKRLQGKTPEPQVPNPRASVARTSALPDPEAVLRERQEERLRRADLFPPRAHEVRQDRPSVPVTTVRHPSVPASPPTLLLNGIDRKIMGIMNATDRLGPEASGDKSELSRLGIKIPGPEKWKGDRSLQAFTEWTQSVAHYFGLYPPMTERLKIQLIGGYLTGDPLDYYWRHVAPTAQQWTAAEVMVALRRQFLVDELSRQAADKFETAEQGSKDIHAFQAYLLKLADQMTEYPSPIALNRRLLNGMKSNISAAIVANRGIDAELSPWEDIVQAAMDQERALRYVNKIKKADLRRRTRRRPSPRRSCHLYLWSPSSRNQYQAPAPMANVLRPARTVPGDPSTVPALKRLPRIDLSRAPDPRVRNRRTLAVPAEVLDTGPRIVRPSSARAVSVSKTVPRKKTGKETRNKTRNKNRKNT